MELNMAFVVFRKGGMILGATPTLPPAGENNVLNNSAVVYELLSPRLLRVRLSKLLGDLLLSSVVVHSAAATPSKKVA